VICYFSIDTPHLWAHINRRGRVTASGEAQSLAEVPLPRNCSRRVGVIRGSDIVVRRTTLPTRNRAKALAALPYALEDSLAEEVDSLHFALLGWDNDGAVAAVVSRQHMDAWLAEARDAGIGIDAIVPDFLLVPRHPQAQITALADRSGNVLIRDGETTGLFLDRDNVPLWWHRQPDPGIAVATNDAELARQLAALGASNVSEWPLGPDLRDWLGAQPPALHFNLLQGTYQPRHAQASGRRLVPAAVLLLAALLVKVGGDGVEYYLLKTEGGRLEAQMRETYLSVFPDARKLDFPRRDMERRAAQLRAGYSGGAEFQQLLGAVSRVVSSGGTSVEDLNFRDNALVVTCTVADFAALDRLKQRFEAEPDIGVELQSSGAREQRVSARFRLWRPTG
jgi:general secretion pathway protein L